MARARIKPKIERAFEQSRLEAELRASAYELLVPVVREPVPRVQDQQQAAEKSVLTAQGA